MTSHSLAFEISLDPAETVRASREITRRARSSTYLQAVVFWLCLGGAFFLAFNVGFVAIEILGVVFALLGLYALFWPMIQRTRLRRYYKNTPALSGPQRYNFTEDGLLLANDGSETLIRWPSVLEAAETREFFLVYYSKKCAYYLPKRVMHSDDVENDLRAFLHAKLGERAAHVTPPA